MFHETMRSGGDCGGAAEEDEEAAAEAAAEAGGPIEASKADALLVAADGAVPLGVTPKRRKRSAGDLRSIATSRAGDGRCG